MSENYLLHKCSSRLTSGFRLLIRNPEAFARKAWRRSALFMNLPRHPIRTISVGRLTIELNLGDPIQESIYAERYEPAEVSLIRSLLQPGQTVIDIGAYVGYLTCVAADAVGPSGQVHAFEPVPAHFERLRRQASLNPDYRIYPMNLAAGREEASLSLALSNDGNAGWNTLVPGFMPASQVGQQMLVRVRPLDTYIEEAQLKKVDFIKIDTEGFELHVLQGLENCLLRHRPMILCEIAPTAYSFLGVTLESLEGFLANLRYEVKDLRFQPLRLETLKKTTNVLLLPGGFQPPQSCVQI